MNLSCILRFLVQNEKDLPAQFPDWVNTHLLPALDWTFTHQYREFASSQVGQLGLFYNLKINSIQESSRMRFL